MSARPRQLSISLPSPWLVSRQWDLLLLIGSLVLVPLPVLMRNGLDLPENLIHLTVTILIGGPHLFATFTYTLMERQFWNRHPFYASGAFLIPPLVIFLGLTSFNLLMTIFFAWASIHVLQQICYLADCYQKKSGYKRHALLKAVDYAVVFSSLYPMAILKLVRGDLILGGEAIKPPFLYGNSLFFVGALSLFLLSAILFAGKCLWELKNGIFNFPKTLLIGLTAATCFVLPIPDQHDLVFQGFNTWHSLQYFVVALWINVLRKERNEIGSPLVRKMAGWDRKARFYLGGVVPTALFLGLVLVLTRVASLPFNQSYYTVVLSALLVHYYFDHWVFSRTEAVVP
jgi:hypothetical protein